MWRAGFCRIKQRYSLGVRLVSCPSDLPWAWEVTRSGDFSFAPIYLTHSTGENADFPASAGAQLCTGGSKTLNTKTSLSTWLGKNRQWETRGRLCRQLALSVWMFVCFFLPMEISFLILRFVMQNISFLKQQKSCLCHSWFFFFFFFWRQLRLKEACVCW